MFYFCISIAFNSNDFIKKPSFYAFQQTRYCDKGKVSFGFITFLCHDVWSLTCVGVGMVDYGIFNSIALSLIALACWLFELQLLLFWVSFLLWSLVLIMCNTG